MAYGPITSWQTDGETMETVTDFIFLGSKITADGEGSHEIKRCLLLGSKSFPCGSAGKESTFNARDLGWIRDWEDPLEKGKATHSRILAWGRKESDMT